MTLHVTETESVISEPIRVHRRPGYQGAVLELGEGYFLPVREGMPVPGVHPGYVRLMKVTNEPVDMSAWSLDHAFQMIEYVQGEDADVSERDAGDGAHRDE